MDDSETKINSRSFRLGAVQGCGGSCRSCGYPRTVSSPAKGGPAMTPPPTPASLQVGLGNFSSPEAGPQLKPQGGKQQRGQEAETERHPNPPFLPDPRWVRGSSDLSVETGAAWDFWELTLGSPGPGQLQHNPPASRMICLLAGHCCCCSVDNSCLTLYDPMDRSMPRFPVLHCLPQCAQTHVH